MSVATDQKEATLVVDGDESFWTNQNLVRIAFTAFNQHQVVLVTSTYRVSLQGLFQSRVSVAKRDSLEGEKSKKEC